jgi:diacylglycerol kinase family enzyme
MSDLDGARLRKEPLNLVVIANPASSRGDPSSVHAVLDRIARASGCTYEWREMTPGRRAGDLARDLGKRPHVACVVVGGDGTVSSVAEELSGTPVAVGIVPFGTGNALARALDIPLEPERAIKLITGPHATTRIDGMRVGGRLYILNVGVGVTSMTVADVSEAVKERFGRAAYFWTGLAKVVGLEPKGFTVQADDEVLSVRAVEATVANADAASEIRWPGAPGIRIDDGRVEILLVQAPGGADYLDAFRRWLERGGVPDPYVRWLTAERRVRIETDEPLPVQADGDVIGRTPVVIDIVPGAVTVIVPRRD